MSIKARTLLLFGIGSSILIFYYQEKLINAISEPETFMGLMLQVTKLGEFSLIAIGVNLAIILVAAVLELIMVGWGKSALKRILFNRSKSTKGDLWCWFLSVFKLYDLFVLIFSFGVFYVLTSVMYYSVGEYSLIRLVESPIAQIIIIFILSDLKHYLRHFFMHKNPFWELHKYHHSATEFNLATTTRGHFLEKGFGTLFDAVLFLIFGAPIEYYVFIAFGKEFYNYLLHSNLNWSLGWVGKHILISPTAHRIHHSISEKHFDKNFGTFFIWWDRIFGTYYHTTEEIIIGVKNTSYNKHGFWKDMIIGLNEFIDAIFRFKNRKL